MRAHPPALPNDIEALRALVLAQQAAWAEQQDELHVLRTEREALKQDKRDGAEEIARLKLLLAKLQRMLFGQKSEKLQHQVDQLQLELEDLYLTQAVRHEAKAPAAPQVERQAPARRPLPEHLPCDIIEHLPDATCCPDCGGAWKRLGEDVSEMLEYVPASLRRVRHVRPRLACSGCDRMAQAVCPQPPDCARPGRPWPVGACLREQVRRPYPAAPASRHLCA